VPDYDLMITDHTGHWISLISFFGANGTSVILSSKFPEDIVWMNGRRGTPSSQPPRPPQTGMLLVSEWRSCNGYDWLVFEKRRI
jgi:hypothetical protein